MTRTDRVHVTVTCDEDYVSHLAAMLVSALDQSPGLGVHLLHPADLDVGMLDRLRRLVEADDGEFDTVAIEPHRVRGINGEKFPVSVWFRILFPELRPELDRVIHLDADTVVRAPLDELWSIDLEDRPFAAVENPLYPWMPSAVERLRLPPGSRYLNSGVLVMDLETLRRERAAERLLEYGLANPDNPWPEQDALSALFAGRWLQLPPRWNAQATIRDLRMSQLPWSRAEIRAARRRPAVQHFSGPFKPWRGFPTRAAVRSYDQRRQRAGYARIAHTGSLWDPRWLRVLPTRLQRRAMQAFSRRVRNRR